jgi:hypothetical protein
VTDDEQMVAVELTADQIKALIHACIDAEAGDDRWRETSRFGLPSERAELARARYAALPLLRDALHQP